MPEKLTEITSENQRRSMRNLDRQNPGWPYRNSLEPHEVWLDLPIAVLHRPQIQRCGRDFVHHGHS